MSMGLPIFIRCVATLWCCLVAEASRRLWVAYWHTYTYSYSYAPRRGRAESNRTLPSDALPRREEVRRGVCIWCSLLPIHTQQSAYCHALQHTSLPILYAYVTINASTILLHIFKWTLCSIFSSGRGVARGLSSIPGIASIIKALHPDNTCHFILGISVVYT